MIEIKKGVVDIIRLTLYGCALFLPKSNPIMRKTLNKFQMRDILQNAWPVLLRIVTVIATKKV